MKRIFKKIKSKKTNEIYDVLLTFDDEGNLLLGKSSCTCIFGSWWRFAGFWRKRGVLCCHMIQIIKEVKNGKKDT
jgi:hypothetical protein